MRVSYPIFPYVNDLLVERQRKRQKGRFHLASCVKDLHFLCHIKICKKPLLFVLFTLFTLIGGWKVIWFNKKKKRKIKKRNSVCGATMVRRSEERERRLSANKPFALHKVIHPHCTNSCHPTS